jgi:hypothetical protein
MQPLYDLFNFITANNCIDFAPLNLSTQNRNFALFRRVERELFLTNIWPSRRDVGQIHQVWWDYIFEYHNKIKILKNSGGENFDTLTKAGLLDDYKLITIPGSGSLSESLAMKFEIHQIPTLWSHYRFVRLYPHLSSHGCYNCDRCNQDIAMGKIYHRAGSFNKALLFIFVGNEYTPVHTPIWPTWTVDDQIDDQITPIYDGRWRLFSNRTPYTLVIRTQSQSGYSYLRTYKVSPF